jgi:hypothetical protein
MDDGNDASLDDFLGDDDADGVTGAGDAAASDGPAVGPEEVEPAVSTYAWSGEPEVCADCGAAVRRRWRDEAGLVCRDCKAW